MKRNTSHSLGKKTHGSHSLRRAPLIGFDVCLDPPSEIIQDIVSTITRLGRSQEGKWLACINPHSYAEIKKKHLQRAFQSAEWIVPDGVGMLLPAYLTGNTTSGRITGSDIFYLLNKELNNIGSGRIFFLGSSVEILDSISKKFIHKYPNLDLVGTYSPPFAEAFTDSENAKIIEIINRASPDVLWVGMTAPKQEAWLAANIANLNIRFAGAIGAVFDFYAGNIRRTPKLFQKLHLEWLWRLFREPRRLWRRTFISAPIFLCDVICERVRQIRLFTKREPFD